MAERLSSMSAMEEKPFEERVLLLEKGEKDGPSAASLLEAAGFDCLRCGDVEAFCVEAEKGAGLAVLCEEALPPAAADRLRRLFERQHAGSELPLLILANALPVPAGSLAAGPTAGSRFFDSLVPFIVLERPVASPALISAARAALRARRRQYESRILEALFELGTVGHAQADVESGRLLRVNRKLCDLLGFSKEDLLAKSHLDISYSADRSLDASSLEKLRRGEIGEYSVEKRLVRKDASILWARLTVTLLRDAGGRPLSTLCAVEDLSDRKAAEEGARETDRRKDELLAMVIHELRDPLGTVLFGLEAMDMPQLDEESLVQAKGMMRRRIQEMSRLMDDLLDFSRSIRGKLAIERQRTNLTKVIQRAVEIARPLAEERQAELSVGPLPASLRLDCDAARMEQVIAKLLANSVRRAGSGGKVQVAAGIESDRISVRVADTGEPISPSLLSRMFDPLALSAGRQPGARSGLDIGLALARKLAEMHGGSLNASSGPDSGAEFHLSLPALREDPSPAEGNSTQSSLHGPARRILVVDDSVDSARLLAEILKFDGHTVRVAHDGREALEEARTYAPELVILDIGLPHMDGYQVARLIRREIPQTPAVLVALTGYGRDEDRRKAKEAGFDHHMVKPIDLQSLQALLASLPAR